MDIEESVGGHIVELAKSDQVPERKFVGSSFITGVLNAVSPFLTGKERKEKKRNRRKYESKMRRRNLPKKEVPPF